MSDISKRFIGYGISKNYSLSLLRPGEEFMEEKSPTGVVTYAISSTVWCIICDGYGCENCKWSGLKGHN